MLKILAVASIASILVAYGLGGRLGELARIRFQLLPLLFLGLVVGLLPLFLNIEGWRLHIVVGVAYLLSAIFLLVNSRATEDLVRTGLAVLLLGWILNAVPIVLNGGMPLSVSAYARAGLTDVPTPKHGGFFKIVLAGPRTRVRWLGDVIPVRPIQQVVSAGDLFLVCGFALVIFGGMKRPRSGGVSGADP